MITDMRLVRVQMRRAFRHGRRSVGVLVGNQKITGFVFHSGICQVWEANLSKTFSCGSSECPSEKANGEMVGMPSVLLVRPSGVRL